MGGVVIVMVIVFDFNSGDQYILDWLVMDVVLVEIDGNNMDVNLVFDFGELVSGVYKVCVMVIDDNGV